MGYLLTFLEGIITFISPCLLPMLPIYISYLAGQKNEKSKAGLIVNSIGFVLGFTIVFVGLGAFAGTIGKLFIEYSGLVNIITGVIVVLFGLSFIGFIKLPFIGGINRSDKKKTKTGFFSSILFGLIFSISWTPCVGAFLGSALMLAATSGESVQGIFMLLSFSAGLGLPFIASAVLISKLQSTFDFIKRHYRIINIISGCLLVLIGILMATGLLGYFLSFLTF